MTVASRRPSGGLSVLVIAAVAALATTAPATAQDDRLRQQLDDARTRIQQLQAEKAVLNGRIRALEADLETSETRAQAMRSSVQRGQDQIRKLSEAVNERTALAADTQSELETARRQAAEAKQAHERLLAEATAMQARIKRQDELIAIAGRKNGSLVEIAEAILADYEQQTLTGRLLAREPFTQLYRVRIENTFQGFRDQVMDQRFVPAVDARATAPE